MECSMKEKKKLVFVLSKNARKLKKGNKTEKDAKSSLINQVLEVILNSITLRTTNVNMVYSSLKR